MRLLLDTCALLWLELDLPKIPAGLLRRLADKSTECYVSPVAAWEITLKWQAGKLALPLPPAEFMAAACKAGGFSSLPIEESALFQLAKLPLLHTDPFDRMLMCQAIESGMTIVTPDALIRQYPVRTLWAD